MTRLHRPVRPASGARWGPLVIVDRIGSGTFGDVYRASDLALDRDVALKLLRSPEAGGHLTEGRLLARVRHPNVVTVFGSAEHDDVCGIWMEFVKGRTLAELVAERGPFPASEVRAIGIDLSRALAAVHASGLLHGDIKAQNVMREESGRIVLMDFGTGRIAGSGAIAEAMAGTPLYLAPEILDGAAAGPASDIYGLGVLLYFLLTGAFPVEGSTLAAIRTAHRSGLRVPVRNHLPKISRRLVNVLDAALAPVPDERIQAPEVLEAALAKSDEAGPRAAIRRWSAIAAAGIILGALGFAAAMASRDKGPAAVTALRVAATNREVTLNGGGAAERVVYRFNPAFAGLVPLNPARLEDLDGDGNLEIMVGVAVYEDPRSRLLRHGEVLNMSPDGVMHWRFAFGGGLRFRDETFGGPWAIADWQAGPAAPTARVAVAAHDYTWWASMVAILDHKGQLLGTFVNPGWMEHLLWVAPDRLAIGGFSNEREEAMIALIDAAHPDGQAPGTAGTPFACVSCPSAAPPLFYATFPRSELNRVTGSSFNRAWVSLLGDKFVVTTIEVTTGDKKEIAMYEFDRGFRFLRARYSDAYWVAHRKLEEEGRITHARAECPERDGPQSINVWTAAGWRKTFPVR